MAIWTEKDTNVYCPECDHEYKVEFPKGLKIGKQDLSWCILCGSGELEMREPIKLYLVETNDMGYIVKMHSKGYKYLVFAGSDNTLVADAFVDPATIDYIQADVDSILSDIIDYLVDGDSYLSGGHITDDGEVLICDTLFQLVKGGE